MKYTFSSDISTTVQASLLEFLDRPKPELVALALPIILIYLKTAVYSKITNKESVQKILNKNT